MREKTFFEIGSEFWNVPVSGEKTNFFSFDTRWYLSGRGALQAIIRDVKNKKAVSTAALPSWCCDSMILPFLEEGIDVRFYPVVFEDGKIQKDLSVASGCDILFVIDYFGYVDDNDKIEFDGIVIRDLTHSLFSKKYDDGDYYFGSLRKWAGFWTGGFAQGIAAKNLPEDEQYASLRREAMKRKEKYIKEHTQDKEYLKIFAAAETYLENCKVIAKADERDIRLATIMDVSMIKAKRRKNAECLLDSLSEIAIFSKMSDSVCPLFVPIFVPDGKRDALRQHLIERGIYCPVHWTISHYHDIDEKTLKLYENELSLVCDQRYDETDMERIITAVREFWGE